MPCMHAHTSLPLPLPCRRQKCSVGTLPLRGASGLLGPIGAAGITTCMAQPADFALLGRIYSAWRACVCVCVLMAFCVGSL